MITVKNIYKYYDKKIVLKNISLLIPNNSITGIIGPNGAGKSTLIKIITGFEYPDSGFFYIKNRKPENFNQIKNEISYMPENMALYPEYFVDEFLDFFHSAVNYENRELLDALSLSSVSNKKIKHLSKGWAQRLKLYTALCNKKEIVILDEPFEGFDPLQMREITEIIRLQNKKGRTFILSIHQLSYAKKICNYLLFLNRGELIAEGSLEDLSKRYAVPDGDLEEILIRIIGQ